MSTARAQRILDSPILPTLARLAAPGALLALFGALIIAVVQRARWES